MWPDLNFRDLPLSLGARNQFAGIYEAVRANGIAKGPSELLKMITEHAYAPDKGTYLPVSDRVKLKGKLPDFSQEVGGPVTPFPCPYFTNPLAIPEGYDTPAFDVELAPQPIERATNVGLIFAPSSSTLERLRKSRRPWRGPADWRGRTQACRWSIVRCDNSRTIGAIAWCSAVTSRSIS